MPLSICAHGCADVVQIVRDGFSQLGSSSVPAFTIEIGLSVGMLNIGVPHSVQNWRVMGLPLSLVLVKSLTLPWVILTDPLGSTTTLAGAPPDAYWQSRQWQTTTASGSAEAS